MNKSLIRRAALGLSFVSLALVASADDRPLFNTIYGPIGLLSVPTADVTPRSQANFGMAIGRDLRSITLNYGVYDSVDLNVAYFDRTDAANKVIAGGKVRIVPANFEYFDIAFGVIDAFDAVNQTAYLIASSKFDNPTEYGQLRLHAGYGTGIFGENFIGGGELLIDTATSAIVEYNGKNMNFGGRFVKDGLKLQGGYGNNSLMFSASWGLKF